MGVSECQLTEILPDDIKSSLPSIDELKTNLKPLILNYNSGVKKQIDEHRTNT